MADAVSYQMNKRVFQLVKDTLVDLTGLPRITSSTSFPLFMRNVADKQGKAHPKRTEKGNRVTAGGVGKQISNHPVKQLVIRAGYF